MCLLTLILGPGFSRSAGRGFSKLLRVRIADIGGVGRHVIAVGRLLSDSLRVRSCVVTILKAAHPAGPLPSRFSPMRSARRCPLGTSSKGSFVTDSRRYVRHRRDWIRGKDLRTSNEYSGSHPRGRRDRYPNASSCSRQLATVHSKQRVPTTTISEASEFDDALPEPASPPLPPTGRTRLSHLNRTEKWNSRSLDEGKFRR